MKNQCRSKILPNPISIREAASKLYAANKYEDTFYHRKHCSFGL